MKQPSVRYVLSFQTERSYQGKRYHWMITSEHNPEVLVAWGHASTQELAEAAARNEINDLISRLSQGGRVCSVSTSSIPYR